MQVTKNWNDKIKVGTIELKNRIVMPALTRERCNLDGVPNDMVRDYYAQRANAAIIFTETVAWCQRGKSSSGSGSLYTEEQAAGWKRVVDKVHYNSGRIFVQINHAGRATNPEKTGGLQVWAPSAIACREKVRYLGGQQAPEPHAMTIEQIEITKNQFRQSMKLAKKAGFDGIQLQGAHGYLIDQFLRSCSNTRTDQYGGSVQNRARFCLQLFDIACQFFEPWQVGVRVSPVSRAKDMFDENPEKTFGYLLQELSRKGSEIVQIRESTEPYNQVNHYGISSKDQIENVCRTLRPYFKGLIIGNDSFTAESGILKIRSGDCDLISFGQWYIGNPDLAVRIIEGRQINTKLDKTTFYGNANGAKGYLDYSKLTL